MAIFLFLAVDVFCSQARILISCFCGAQWLWIVRSKVFTRLGASISEEGSRAGFRNAVFYNILVGDEVRERKLCQWVIHYRHNPVVFNSSFLSSGPNEYESKFKRGFYVPLSRSRCETMLYAVIHYYWCNREDRAIIPRILKCLYSLCRRPWSCA
jgi:hypothetical protein